MLITVSLKLSKIPFADKWCPEIECEKAGTDKIKLSNQDLQSILILSCNSKPVVPASFPSYFVSQFV